MPIGSEEFRNLCKLARLAPDPDSSALTLLTRRQGSGGI